MPDNDISTNFTNLRQAVVAGVPERAFGLDEEEKPVSIGQALHGMTNPDHLKAAGDWIKGAGAGVTSGVFGLAGDIGQLAHGAYAYMTSRDPTLHGRLQEAGAAMEPGRAVLPWLKTSHQIAEKLTEGENQDVKLGAEFGINIGQLAAPEAGAAINTLHKGIGQTIESLLQPVGKALQESTLGKMHEQFEDLGHRYSVFSPKEVDRALHEIFHGKASEAPEAAPAAGEATEEVSHEEMVIDHSKTRYDGDHYDPEDPTHLAADAVYYHEHVLGYDTDEARSSAIATLRDSVKEIQQDESLTDRAKKSISKTYRDAITAIRDGNEAKMTVLEGEPGSVARELTPPAAATSAAETGVKAGPKAPVSAAEAAAQQPIVTYHAVDPHQSVADFFMKQQTGEEHAPLSIDAYARGEGKNPVMWNLDRMNSVDDIKDAIARVASEIPKPETITHDMTISLADQFGLSAEELTQMAGRSLSGPQIVALKTGVDSVANQALNKAILATVSKAPEDIKAAYSALSKFAMLMDYATKARAESGRALDAWKILNQGDRTGEALSGMLKAIGGPDKAVDQLNMISQLGDPIKVSRFLSATMRDQGHDTFMKYYYNVLLSNPKTIIKKLTSDSLMMGWNVMSRYAAATFSDSVTMKEASQLAYGYYSSFTDAVRVGGQALRAGESQFQRQYASLDAMSTEGKPISALLKTEPQGEYSVNQPSQAWKNTLRSMLPTSWIAGADDFAKYINYRAELRGLLMRDGLEKGLEGEELNTHLAQSLNDVPIEIHKQAVNAALQNTFQEPLVGLGKSIQQTMDKMNLPIGNTGASVPVGRILMPFIKVPLNIMKWSYTNSPLPLAFPSDAFKATMMAGGAARDIQIAKMGMGSALAGGAMMLALSGRITGRGPADPQMQRAWRAAGNEPYSVHLGDRTYSYNSVEPMGLMIGAIADTIGIMKFAHEEDTPALAGNLAFGLGNAILSKTYFSGVADFFQALEQPDAKSGNWLAHNIASLVPASGLGAGIQQSLDDWRRTHYGLMDQIESKLPFVQGQQPVARTIWGDPIPLNDALTPLGIHGGFARMLSPIGTRSVEKVEPIDKWVWDHRLDFKNGTSGQVGFSLPGLNQTFSAGPEISASVKLTPQQHDDLVVAAGNGYKDPTTGLGCKDALNAMIAGQYPGHGVQAQWNKGSDALRTEMVQRMVGNYRQAAKEQLLLKNPGLNTSVREMWMAREKVLQAGQQQPQGATQ